MQHYDRLELAHNQLETAIGLFIAGGDRFSCITLAGAADVLLTALASREGKETFTEFSMPLERDPYYIGLSREDYGRHMNDVCGINHLKHLDPGQDDHFELEPEECALASILKALANYATIVGTQAELVQTFKIWVKLNLDPKKYNVDSDPNWKAESEAQQPQSGS